MSYQVICLAAVVALSTVGSKSAQEYNQVVQSLSAELTNSLRGPTKRAVAVVDFTDLQGNVTELGRFLAEEFSVALTSHGVETVDRTHLRAILAEHKLAATGLIDPQTARQLGKIAGVDGLVTGTLTPFGESVRLVVKVLDVSTARVIEAASGDFPRTKTIDELIAKGIRATTGETPTGRAPNEKIAQTSVNGFLFSLAECRRTGPQVECEFSIRNNGPDRSFTCYRERSRAIDARGVQYRVVDLNLAGKPGDLFGTSDFFKGITLSLRLLFEGVEADVGDFAVVQPVCEGLRIGAPWGVVGGVEAFPVTVRTVKIR